jgi:hypothetical protein
MQFLEYIFGLAIDNMVWVTVVALLFVVKSPYHVWLLLTNNRPARGTGWKMWLADRYIQIWLSPCSLDSSDTPYEYRTVMGNAETLFQRHTTRKQIDLKLEEHGLVRRGENTVRARREVHLYARNWLTYFLCKWYLILFWGDTRNWYEELTPPPSRIKRHLMEVSREFAVRLFLLVLCFLLLILLTRSLSLLAWLFKWYGALVEKLMN